MKTKNTFQALLFFAMLMLIQHGMAQDCTTNYSIEDSPYINSPKSSTQTVIRHINEWLEKDLSQITTPFVKDKKSAYRERYDYLETLLRDDYFLFYDSLQNMVNDLGNRLLEKNPISRKDRIQFLISRSGIPNASCRGEGTIVLNAGLITCLENTNQLAFIMAHELAHHHYDHVNESIGTRIAFLNSKETNKRISAAKKGKEMANSDLKDWLKENTFDFSKHSRTHELETDSLGIIFYLEAGFPASEALSALQLLEFIDEAPTPMTDLSDHFNFEGYPWKEEWRTSHLSGLSLVKITDEEKILLRTHPELEERVGQAKSMLTTVEEKEENDLCDWKPNLNLEILERYYETKNLFPALVHGLQILDKKPENIYVNAIVAHSLLDLCQARKDHRVSNYIPAPNSRMREDFFQMATFLDNLSFSNLKEITRRWVAKNCIALTDEEVKTALEIKLAQMENNFVPETSRAIKFKNKWPFSVYL